MSTAWAKSGEQRRQNGWASAPEYDVLRGLNGNSVAFKAALQTTPARRELLYFLQALSLREGGAKRIARELVEMFPERLGTPAMHKAGCRLGKKLTAQQSAEIEGELDPRSAFMWAAEALLDGDRQEDPSTDLEYKPRSAESFLHECRHRAQGLDEFLEALCCDPKMEVAPEGGEAAEVWHEHYRREVAGALGTDDSNGFKRAELIYFRDVLGALYEFQRGYSERARAEYVETSIGKIVFEALDYVLETGRSALIEGNSGYGKSTALKAWVEMHPARARYVQLSGITSRKTFFQKLAKALGVANGGGLISAKLQSRVEDFLQRTKLILIVDEGQYLWPQGKRIESHPELINWLNTSCYNEGVPFAISATRQFTLRRQAVEKSSDWSSEQLRRRTRKVFQLPDAPTTADLQAVASKLLSQVGDLGESAVDLVVGYALTSRGYFQTITDAIDDARLIAKRAGRERITFKDLKCAIYEWRAQSDAALQRVFDSKAAGRRRVPAPGPLRMESTADEPEVNESLIAPSRAIQDGRGGTSLSRRRVAIPEAGPVLTG